jgi:dTDP-4-dehydrorhamnose 3,5-epimerase
MKEISEIWCGVPVVGTHGERTVIKMADARVIQSPLFSDERGSFEVPWERHEMDSWGIQFNPVSSALSFNVRSGTLRGLHYQTAPHSQSKVVSCASGRVLDVIADLRPESPSYLRWAATELRAGSGRSVYVPSGYAHGFLTLSENATVLYLLEGEYKPEAAATVRWNDPLLGICWPNETPILSDRDRLAGDFLA